MYWVRMDAGTVRVTKARGLEEESGAAEVLAEAEFEAEPETKADLEADAEVEPEIEPEY